MTTWPVSTWASDSEATHVVKIGNTEKVFGWYTSEFEAYRIASMLKRNGYLRVVVEPYSPPPMDYSMENLFS
jgi:hypothetical protein